MSPVALGGEFNGLAFGPGTAYHVAGMEGFDDLPPVRSSDLERPNAHGAYPGVDYLGRRTVVLTLQLVATTPAEFDTQVQTLKDALTILPEGEYPLRFAGNTRRLYCRPRNRHIPNNTLYPQRHAAAPIEFVASDPRIYDDTETTASTALPESSGGMEFPVTFPLVFGTVTSEGTLLATNDGNFPSPLVVTFVGPVDNPSLTNVTLAKTVTFDMSLADGDQLVVDLNERSAILNGTASRSSKLRSGSQWFDLDPGDNELRFSASTYSAAAYAYLAWRSAWI